MQLGCTIQEPDPYSAQRGETDVQEDLRRLHSKPNHADGLVKIESG